MTTLRKKILVIENQRHQYDRLKERLSEYDILPSSQDYSLFTDCVRIFLSKRYSETKKNRAFDHIKRITEQLGQPDMLLIDYKLSGAHDGGTGFNIAKKLRSDLYFKGIPIIFLSRTAENDEAVLEERKHIPGSHWIAKSYAGSTKNLDEVYFSKHVKSVLPDLFLEPEHEQLTALCERLIADKFFEEACVVLKELLGQYPKLSELPQKKKDALKDMDENRKTYTRNVLNTTIAILKS